jgi:hypothetical protein
VSEKSYYDLLELAATASSDDVKRAFRQQIARYHPDKVQHLGKEFQALAADRAAELTEAYRILSNTALREEYDRSREREGPVAPTATAASARPERPAPADPPTASQPAPPHPSEPEPLRPRGHQFSEDRATGDAVVKKATVGRIRQALTSTFGSFDEMPVRGFDLACVPKPKRFSRARPPRLLVRFVPRVDGAAIGEAWAHATKWNVPPSEEICLLLMGPSMVSARELADAIHEQRRKPSRSGKMTLIPVDTRDWQAHIPVDAPPAAKTVLEHLRARS